MLTGSPYLSGGGAFIRCAEYRMQRFGGMIPRIRRYASTVWYSLVGSQNLTPGRFRETAMILQRWSKLWMSPESCQRKYVSPER